MAGRIVVLISGSGSNMEALIDSCEAAEVPGTVVAVVADRSCGGLAVADRRGVETHVVDFKAYRSREEWSEALRDVVMKFDPDLVVHAGFMRIISPVYVDAFPGKLINLHPSLLPAFPGAHGVRDALAHGAKVTGSTIHFIDYEVDHGPIILQEAVRIEQSDTEATLHERIKTVEHRLLSQACRLVLDGKLRIEEGRVLVDQS